MQEGIGGVRDHLANERTHLAWLRTGANVMVVGLAVARFADNGRVTASSLIAGGLLVVVGAVGIVFGTLRYRLLAEQLRHGTAEAAASTSGPALAAAVFIFAMAAATTILLFAA